MTAMDPTFLLIERMANAALDDVMEKLHVAVREAVVREVGEEIADQRAELEEELAVSAGLVESAAKLHRAFEALEKCRFAIGERYAREQLDPAIREVSKAYREHMHIHTKRKGKAR